METIININNLSKSYGKIQAVKNIDFSVIKGEIFGLLGPNGAGKTTTLEIIEGLKKQDGGKVQVLGYDNLKQIEEIKKRIGVQLQSSGYLPYLTLGELLELFSSFYGIIADKIKLLTLVNLKEKENDEVKNLSGGQKQRFTIATSLINQPEILFLDEPTTGLDPSARRQMWQLIKQINSQGITVVITTHYMEEAEFLCHRVAIMDHGKILQIEKPHKLIENLSHTTQVSFLVNEQIQEDLFKNFSDIEKIYKQYPKIIMEIKSLDHISRIVEILKTNKINFSGFTVKTASLEDVYLDLTGHEFEIEKTT